MTQPVFVAIDFETSDPSLDCACAVGVVRVEGDQIVAREHRLIRPPKRPIRFTEIHGITWSMVAHEPVFRDVWPELAPLFDGAQVAYAHNASFDRGVLRACCAAAGLPMPNTPFHCTVTLARRAWNLRPTRLPDVARYLGVTLDHHNALSDAEACARIAIAARADGVESTPIGQPKR